jgi:hypothetical protein
LVGPYADSGMNRTVRASVTRRTLPLAPRSS